VTLSVDEQIAVWERIGDRPVWECCSCGRQAIGARGEPDVHLRARLVACGWTYARLGPPLFGGGDGPETGQRWCPWHDPSRYARAVTVASPPIPFPVSDLRSSL
jgi:hypothetical protein